MDDLRALASQAIAKAKAAKPLHEDGTTTELGRAQIKANSAAFEFFAEHGETLGQALLDRL